MTTNMNNTNDATMTGVPATNYKFPAAKAIIEACMGNLTDNMSDPDSAFAAKDARDAAWSANGEADDKPVDPKLVERIKRAMLKHRD